jgi:hypothetical protein
MISVAFRAKAIFDSKRQQGPNPMSKSYFSSKSGDELVYDGSVTLNGATPVTVSNVPLGTKATWAWGLATPGGSVGALPTVKTVTLSTQGGVAGQPGGPPPNGSFTVAGTAGDTSTYNFRITN